MKESKSQVIGLRGEEIAREYLLQKGFKLMHNNYRCKLGEIDLIMREGAVTVFIEVRLRALTSYGRGYETVSYQKQKKIINTARVYQQREGYWGDVRFDVVSIESDTNTGEDRIEHIRDAFGE